MGELKIKLENLHVTLTDPVSNEDIRAAWLMVEEILVEVGQLEANLSLAENVRDEALRTAKRYKAEIERLQARLWWTQTAPPLRAEEIPVDVVEKYRQYLVTLGSEPSGFFCPKCGNVYPENGMRCLTCNPIKKR